jgi:hypothetical protein
MHEDLDSVGVADMSCLAALLHLKFSTLFKRGTGPLPHCSDDNAQSVKAAAWPLAVVAKSGIPPSFLEFPIKMMQGFLDPPGWAFM